MSQPYWMFSFCSRARIRFSKDWLSVEEPGDRRSASAVADVSMSLSGVPAETAGSGSIVGAVAAIVLSLLGSCCFMLPEVSALFTTVSTSLPATSPAAATAEEAAPSPVFAAEETVSISSAFTLLSAAPAADDVSLTVLPILAACCWAVELVVLCCCV